MRAEIARTTKEIIRLVGRRNDLARELGRLKAKVSLPIEDEGVENSLLRDVVDECDQIGLERAAGLKIFSILLSESKKTQGLQQQLSPMSVAKCLTSAAVNETSRNSAASRAASIAPFAS